MLSGGEAGKGRGALRGLDIRARFALVKVLATIYTEVEEYERADFHGSLCDAVSMGYHEFWSHRIEEVPAMFVDEPALVEAWECGNHQAMQSEEMAHCSGCKNELGDPCPYHG